MNHLPNGSSFENVTVKSSLLSWCLFAKALEINLCLLYLVASWLICSSPRHFFNLKIGILLKMLIIKGYVYVHTNKSNTPTTRFQFD